MRWRFTPYEAEENTTPGTPSPEELEDANITLEILEDKYGGDFLDRIEDMPQEDKDALWEALNTTRKEGRGDMTPAAPSAEPVPTQAQRPWRRERPKESLAAQRRVGQRQLNRLNRHWRRAQTSETCRKRELGFVTGSKRFIVRIA